MRWGKRWRQYQSLTYHAQIPISKERRKAYLEKEKSNILASIAEAKESRAEKWTIKQMEKAAKELDVSLQRLNDESAKDDLLTFEELGIDFVAIDEAHFFKNLAVFSKMSNVGGISSSGSKRASDMLLKCQYLNEMTPGRGIVFATGTPVSNTMVEMYVMQKYLQSELLEKMGILHFDSWAANFGEVTTSLELAPEGNGFRFKNRFNHFVNLPELMTAFRQVADVQTADMLDLDVPSVRTGKPIIVSALPDEYTQKAVEQFVIRAEQIRNGKVDPSEDNFLKITHEARLLGTDARLLDPFAPDHPDGKLNMVVENVLKEYELAREKGIIGCQLIFSDIGTPKMSWNPEWTTQYMEKGFDIYNYLKTELVKRGIPADEITFVHDAKSDAAREQLFKEMRLGKKKIMIGSTDKCGTGVNVQTHLVAMHHVDCPWKPSSIEQREGRGIRQGNENKEVAIYRYVTEETFDAYLWGIVENKQRFISQVMTGKAISRTCEDIDEATLNYAEIKAIATGNPLIREKMELDNEVQKLTMLKTNHERSKYELQKKVVKDFPEAILRAKKHLENIKRDITDRDKVYVRNASSENETGETEKNFFVQIHGVTYADRKDGGTAILYAIKQAPAGTTSTIGTFYGFELQCEKNYIGIDYLLLKGETSYKVEASLNPVGVTVKLNHLIEGMEAEAELAKEKIADLTRNLEQAKMLYEKKFDREEELRTKKDRLKELNALLEIQTKHDELEPTVEEVEDAFYQRESKSR